MDNLKARIEKTKLSIARADEQIATNAKVLEKGRELLDEMNRRQNDDKRFDSQWL